MHVMVIPSWYSSSRNEVHGSFFKEQFKALSNAEIKVTVAYNEIWPITMIGRIKESRGIKFSIEDNLRTYRYKDFNYLPKNHLMFKSFNMRMDKLYKEIVKKEGKIDIIHAHSALWGGISAQYISNKYNIPLVITEHSSIKYAKYVRDSYKKYIYEAYNKADALIAVGNGLKSEMKNYTRNDIKVIHNMVDLKKFRIDSKQCENNSYGDVFNIFSCAFLEDGKGMEVLIEAFSLAFKNKNAILRIGGDGSLRGKLQGMINELGMENQIFLLGALSRERVSEEMKNCKCFVLASEHETFGVVYIEALACGKPVIGTYNGGADEIIQDYNGIIIEKRNVEKLRDALIKMKNEYKTYDENEISERTILSYSEKILVEKLKGVYKEVYER